MLQLAAQIQAAVATIRQQWQGKPRVGIILGTGIGPLAQQIETEASIDYDAIPHFLRPLFELCGTHTCHKRKIFETRVPQLILATEIDD